MINQKTAFSIFVEFYSISVKLNKSGVIFQLSSILLNPFTWELYSHKLSGYKMINDTCKEAIEKSKKLKSSEKSLS